MPDLKISALTDGVTAVSTDRIPVARSPFASGDNRWVTPAYIATFIAGLSLFEPSGAVAAHEAAVDPHPQYLTVAEGNAAYQPLDSDLTAIAAVATTSYGRSLLALADAAALTALPNVFTSALQGVVPASGGGTTNFLRADGAWAVAGSGDVVGPASATDNSLARFDTTSGKLIQNSSGATLSDNFSLSLAGGTITADEPIINLTRTWNAAGVTFTGIKSNVTDTASAAGSLLLDLQVGGSSKFSVSKGGVVTIPQSGASVQNPALTFSGATTIGFSTDGVGIIAVQSGAKSNYILQGFWVAASGGAFAWSSTSDATATRDLVLLRDAADTLALRRTTNAQTFRVYNTFTDASNYELGNLRWSANELLIRTEAAGTGSNRNIKIHPAGSLGLGSVQANRWTISTSGHFLADTDNIYDIGASGATRPRSIFLAGTATVAGAITGGGNVFAGAAFGFVIGNRSGVRSEADGVIDIVNNAGTDFNRLQFGGRTASFPALKRSTTVLQSRLADDSDFAPIQGRIRAHANAVAETPTATHTLRYFDAGGTEYKVLAVAA